jgi:hypothetical protein
MSLWIINAVWNTVENVGSNFREMVNFLHVKRLFFFIWKVIRQTAEAVREIFTGGFL